MADRSLSADEVALWSRLAATVTPIGRAPRVALPQPLLEPPPKPGRLEPGQALPAPARTRSKPAAPADTLDGGWDRRLRRGTVAPDRTIDLHGHTLASARGALEHALARALADEARVLLVVTGKPPKAGEGRRGLIRASIFDWLAQSPHAAAIVAVRNAHPRHGGAGALYLILRRRRGG